MDVLINDSIPISAWHELLSRDPHATPFQSPEFYNLFNAVAGLSAQAIAISQTNKIIALAVVTIQKEPGLKGYFSRRGIIYGGFLMDPEFTEAVDLLLQQISLYISRKCIYLETRNFSDYSNYRESFKRNGWDYLPYLNFQVSTSAITSLVASISSSRMRQIKKAIKNGVTWKEASDLKEVESFYMILRTLYKNKIKKPLFSLNFFREFYERDLGKYLLVWYKNEIIGGILCPILKNQCIYEFYICGLDYEYKDQYPSIMATWAAMEYANQNNIPLFDFMGAGKPDEQYGVRDFKARFGGKEVEYGRFLKIGNRFLYEFGKLYLIAKLVLKI